MHQRELATEAKFGHCRQLEGDWVLARLCWRQRATIVCCWESFVGYHWEKLVFDCWMGKWVFGYSPETSVVGFHSGSFALAADFRQLVAVLDLKKSLIFHWTTNWMTKMNRNCLMSSKTNWRNCSRMICWRNCCSILNRSLSLSYYRNLNWNHRCCSIHFQISCDLYLFLCDLCLLILCYRSHSCRVSFVFCYCFCFRNCPICCHCCCSMNRWSSFLPFEIRFSTWIDFSWKIWILFPNWSQSLPFCDAFLSCPFCLCSTKRNPTSPTMTTNLNPSQISSLNSNWMLNWSSSSKHLNLNWKTTRRLFGRSRPFSIACSPLDWLHWSNYWRNLTPILTHYRRFLRLDWSHYWPRWKLGSSHYLQLHRPCQSDPVVSPKRRTSPIIKLLIPEHA